MSGRAFRFDFLRLVVKGLREFGVNPWVFGWVKTAKSQPSVMLVKSHCDADAYGGSPSVNHPILIEAIVTTHPSSAGVMACNSVPYR
jgi:hypothetical protein